MKIFLKIRFFLFILSIHLFCSSLMAQTGNWLSRQGGGEINIEANGLCLNKEDRASILEYLKTNVSQLNLKRNSSNNRTGDFGWPLMQSSDLNYNDFHATTNFVDHDNTTELLDYACQKRSYNGHKGTDFILWPFPWYIYENNYAEVVAVKDGIIVGKQDGQFDSNCAWINGTRWNAIYLMHDDGYVTWYGHLKENSLTSKAIGDAVVKGEYLGVVASSGFSDAPHLHFEVYNNNDEIVDPYSGNCYTQESLWASQKEYREPTINAVLTHSEAPEMGCPSANETPHFLDDFNPSDQVFFAAYFHDQTANQEYNYSITDPNGNVWRNWMHSSNETFNASYWYWYYNMPSDGPFGVWNFKVERNGQVAEHEFNYGVITATHENEFSKSISIFPNPSNDKIYLAGEISEVAEISIFNNLGEELLTTTKWKQGVDVSALTNGIFYVHIKTTDKLEIMKAIVVQN